jgi:hypothetical protein
MDVQPEIWREVTGKSAEIFLATDDHGLFRRVAETITRAACAPQTINALPPLCF